MALLKPCGSGLVGKIARHKRTFSAAFQCHDGSNKLDGASDGNNHAIWSSQTPSNASYPQTNHMRLKANQRDLVLDVLGAATTKREARSYLGRFQQTSVPTDDAKSQSAGIGQSSASINLGNLFTDFKTGKTLYHSVIEPRHVAVVFVRATETISDRVLHGVTRTLSQLSQLGMQCIVMLDPTDSAKIKDKVEIDDFDEKHATFDIIRKKLLFQADRVINALEMHLNQRARRLDSLFENVDAIIAQKPSSLDSKALRTTNLRLLEQCLDSDTIPIILPITQDKNAIQEIADPTKSVVTLVRTLSGTIDRGAILENNQIPPANLELQSDRLLCSVDRLIVLDPAGGVLRYDGTTKSHVFINLEQEYSTIHDQLKIDRQTLVDDCSVVGSNISNLNLAREILRFLPPTSSALITSPDAVARYEFSSAPASDVGTRPRKNLLLHNILTDKPVRSSSLPNTRLEESITEPVRPAGNLSATFLKHGMPITIVPDPKSQPWKTSKNGCHVLSLNDPRLDIGRLVHLVEDSFGRPLDQKHYFSRIAPSIAGIIVAGAYEGGAILTWEKPSSSSAQDSKRLVPYLDKFAVLKRSQGAGGVADVVFSAMVRDCFPQGVCWRSRSDNPVNRWYFERAQGSMKLIPKKGDGAATQSWTMFWTTNNIDEQRLADYEEVCRGIRSSWADGKAKLD